MITFIFSKTKNQFIPIEKWEIKQCSTKEIHGLNYSLDYYFLPETLEYATNSYIIKYACSSCGKEQKSTIAAFRRKNSSLRCLKCAIKESSNNPIVKEKKRQIVLHRDHEVYDRQSASIRKPEVNNARIEKFKKAVKNQSAERREEIKIKKQNTWNNKSDIERQTIFEKVVKTGFKWKSIETRFGEINCQGFEDSVVKELSNIESIKSLERGSMISLENKKKHFPDFKIKLSSGEIILIEVKSDFLYSKYKEEIEYKKLQAIKQGLKYYLIILENRSQTLNVLKKEIPQLFT